MEFRQFSEFSGKELHICSCPTRSPIKTGNVVKYFHNIYYLPPTHMAYMRGRNFLK